MKLNNCLFHLALIAAMAGCGSSIDNANDTGLDLSEESSQKQQGSALVRANEIQLNQIGFLPKSPKYALVPELDASMFEVVDLASSEVVYQGELSSASEWSVAKGQAYKLADLSSVQDIGKYLIRIEGAEDKEFEVNKAIYGSLHDAALKSYYFNRASLELTSEYAGDWSRPLGHLDQEVLVHESAATDNMPAGSLVSSAKGWYDAGDYGKYVVNSGIATYTLLAAFEHYPNFYQHRSISIPESNDSTPDILDEIKWNLDWLQTMQAEDGSVYHKLTTLSWPGVEMPHEDTRARYVIGQSTSAALDFAAVMAVASRVYGAQGEQFSSQSKRWLEQAQKAWQWAIANNNLPYSQPQDVTSGQYGDNYFKDEFAWAAAELFLTTKETIYLQAFQTYRQSFGALSWQSVGALASMSILAHGKEDKDSSLYESLQQELLAVANEFLQQHQQSAIKVAMVEQDFVWGSNSTALNKAMVLIQAYKLTQEISYKHAATELVAYVLGKNPTGYSFVTGFGSKSALYPHHRLSAADGKVQPVPGMLVGGPQNGQQDDCSYPSDEPALSYLDDWCSYSTNEIAINWNAPLVYVLASLLNENE